MARCAFKSAKVITNYNAKKYEKLQDGCRRNVCSILGRLCNGKYNATTKYLALLEIIELILISPKFLIYSFVYIFYMFKIYLQ